MHASFAIRRIRNLAYQINSSMSFRSRREVRIALVVLRGRKFQ
jgi:hypothetical protein